MDMHKNHVISYHQRRKTPSPIKIFRFRVLPAHARALLLKNVNADTTEFGRVLAVGGRAAVLVRLSGCHPLQKLRQSWQQHHNDINLTNEGELARPRS